MRNVTDKCYNNFITYYHYVTIGNTSIKLIKNPYYNGEPNNFCLENTSVWNFPNRGKWATHHLNSKYRGNWAPQVPRNLILRYTKENDVILDPFSGSGTSLIEAKITRRHSIGIDVNYDAIMVAKNRLCFPGYELWEPTVYHGDARNLSALENNSIDLVTAHPPYANIIKYSNNAEGDISHCESIEKFVINMNMIASELCRVLKKSKLCAVLIGDIRKNTFQIPLSYYIMNSFISQGFTLKEHIIKIQHNTMTSLTRKKYSTNKFFFLAHENLFIFKK